MPLLIFDFLSITSLVATEAFREFHGSTESRSTHRGQVGFLISYKARSLLKDKTDRLKQKSVVYSSKAAPGGVAFTSPKLGLK
jgi:hypothetical protein